MLEEQDEKIDEIYGKIRDPSYGFQKINMKKKSMAAKGKGCFYGSDFVNWVAQQFHVQRFIAEQIGQNFLDRLIIQRVDEESDDLTYVFKNDQSVYRFQEDVDPYVLNCTRIYSGFLRSYKDIIADVYQRQKILYEKHIHRSTVPTMKTPSLPIHVVDYDNVLKSPEYKQFVKSTIELQAIKPSSIKNEKELLSLFVNVYNILLFHASLEKERPRYRYQLTVRPSPKYLAATRSNLPKFSYLIEGKKFSIFDIEHGILRGNRKPVVFSKTDPRRKLAVELFDPRVHFVMGNPLSLSLLVSSSVYYSNPNSSEPSLVNNMSMTLESYGHPVNTPAILPLFDENTIYPAMEKGIEQFVNSNEHIKVQPNKCIVLPWAFEAHSIDFGNLLETLQWMYAHCTLPAKRAEIKNLIDSPTGLRVLFDLTQQQSNTGSIFASTDDDDLPISNPTFVRDGHTFEGFSPRSSVLIHEQDEDEECEEEAAPLPTTPTQPAATSSPAPQPPSPVHNQPLSPLAQSGNKETLAQSGNKEAEPVPESSTEAPANAPKVQTRSVRNEGINLKTENKKNRKDEPPSPQQRLSDLSTESAPVVLIIDSDMTGVDIHNSDTEPPDLEGRRQLRSSMSWKSVKPSASDPGSLGLSRGKSFLLERKNSNKSLKAESSESEDDNNNEKEERKKRSTTVAPNAVTKSASDSSLVSPEQSLKKKAMWNAFFNKSESQDYDSEEDKSPEQSPKIEKKSDGLGHRIARALTVSKKSNSTRNLNAT